MARPGPVSRDPPARTRSTPSRHRAPGDAPLAPR
jgi:hypothetical protein